MSLKNKDWKFTNTDFLPLAINKQCVTGWKSVGCSACFLPPGSCFRNAVTCRQKITVTVTSSFRLIALSIVSLPGVSKSSLSCILLPPWLLSAKPGISEFEIDTNAPSPWVIFGFGVSLNNCIFAVRPEKGGCCRRVWSEVLQREDGQNKE